MTVTAMDLDIQQIRSALNPEMKRRRRRQRQRTSTWGLRRIRRRVRRNLLQLGRFGPKVMGMFL